MLTEKEREKEKEKEKEAAQDGRSAGGGGVFRAGRISVTRVTVGFLTRRARWEICPIKSQMWNKHAGHLEYTQTHIHTDALSLSLSLHAIAH